MKFYVNFIIKFYNQRFMSLIIFDFRFYDDENKKVDDFLMISIFIINYIDLFLNSDVINIYFVI